MLQRDLGHRGLSRACRPGEHNKHRESPRSCGITGILGLSFTAKLSDLPRACLANAEPYWIFMWDSGDKMEVSDFSLSERFTQMLREDIRHRFGERTRHTQTLAPAGIRQYRVRMGYVPELHVFQFWRSLRGR